MQSAQPPICSWCSQDFDAGTWSCKAFDSIPDIIIESTFDHRRKHPAQKNDVVFEPLPGAENDVLWWAAVVLNPALRTVKEID